MSDRDKLIELIRQGKDMTPCEKNSEYNCKGVKCEDCESQSIADYLISNGVILPKFNVGDTVWYITGIHRTIVKSAIVEEIIINSNGVSDLYVKNDMGRYFENSVDIFYPTKEEAEQALKERNNEN